MWEGVLRQVARLYRRFMRRPRRHPIDVLRAARGTMRRARYAVLSTRSEDGVDARVVQPFAPDDHLTVFVGAHPASRKVAQVRACDRAALVYVHGDAYVSLVGRVRVVDALEERRRRFTPLFHAFFPDGPEGEYVLLELVPERVEVMDFTHRITPEPFGLAPAVAVRRDGAWTARIAA